jgi:rubrerythrin
MNKMNMNNNTSSSAASLNRRSFLRIGGITATSAAVLAACGGESHSDIARIGLSPETTALKTEHVTDEVLLRTAMSVEYLAIDTYNAVAKANVLTGDAASALEVAKAFIADHTEHAAALEALITARGGKPFKEANPRMMSLYVEPALALVVESDTPAADALAFAHALETLAASTYQGFVAQISEAALRADAMVIGAQEARHATVLAQAIRPGIEGLLPSVDDAGAALVAAVPSTFGTLAAVQVALGKPGESGSKNVLSIETPSLNSLIYVD